MQISEKDFGEIDRVSKIILFVDEMDIKYAERESDVIFRKQPFIISLILGYSFDLNQEEHGEVIKVLYIIWEYFKVFKKIGSKKVTEEQYERITARNLQMLKNYVGEPGEAEKSAVIESDLSHLDSKTIWTAVIFRFKTNKTLLNLNEEIKGAVLIGMKTLIECLEEIVKE
jgi:hypothetical protein